MNDRTERTQERAEGDGAARSRDVKEERASDDQNGGVSGRAQDTDP